MSDTFLDMAISRGLITPAQAKEVESRGGSSRDVAVSLGYMTSKQTARIGWLFSMKDLWLRGIRPMHSGPRWGAIQFRLQRASRISW